jgi:LysR family transcriptional regulator, regulator for bpeEF and oprC
MFPIRNNGEAMDLTITRLFVKVVQNGSFSKAALLLKVPKSTVSKAVSRLEKETGTKLLLRTTRSLTLTAAGRAYYDSCLGPIQTLEDAHKSLHGKDSILSGLVRITASEDLGIHVIAPCIGGLIAKHPGLDFELHYTDEVIDLVKDGFDLAVRLGRLNQSNFKVKKAGEVCLILVAAPDYLKRNDKIRQPSDLSKHDCITLNHLDLLSKWSLKSSKGSVQVPIRARASSNQMNSLLRTAISGGGVALVPNYICINEFKAGRLVHVLPDWHNAGRPVSLVSPLSSASSARLKVTTDSLFEAVHAALSPEAY